MSSGRSARLPQTPNSSRNKNLTISPSEQNCNDVHQCKRGSFIASTTTAINSELGQSSSSNVGQEFSSRTDSGTESIPGDTVEVLGPELALATSQVLENMSENERKMIIEVLNRDENLRQRDATRIMLLRAELIALRHKGSINIGTIDNKTHRQDHQNPQHPQELQQQQIEQKHQNYNFHESSRHCGRCTNELGRITNRGAPCAVCKLRVCKKCQDPVLGSGAGSWVCVVCHKQMEIQSVGGEWLKKSYKVGSSSAVDHMSTSVALRKSIRRSWTISNPQDDPNNPNLQNQVADNLYPQQINLIEAQSAGSYPLLHNHYQLTTQAVNYDTGKQTTIECGSVGTISTTAKYNPLSQRRILRQSTLPSTLNNDRNLSSSGSNLTNSINLTAPTSPNQMQKSPISSNIYNSDDIMHMNINECNNYFSTQCQQQKPNISINTPQREKIGPNSTTYNRLQIRRQSTLPTNPAQNTILMSTSPNRAYSRSPERSPGEQRFPQFIRQTSFPEPSTSTRIDQSQTPTLTFGSPSCHYRTKLLPNAKNYQQDQQILSSDNIDYIPKSRIMRQATLPNPEAHIASHKLLPTSPPKRQTSPQFRSPELSRQQTLPNSEQFCGNSLTVHPSLPNPNSQAKFLPISPRAKQNFLFPNAHNRRQFLSQQNVPTIDVIENVSTIAVNVSNEQYSSSQSVNVHQTRDSHAKMIKVRSHSNEEYSNSKAQHSENRRLLPEIPTNRAASRSPSRLLVRQDCLKEDRTHDPHGLLTFGEVKHEFHQFQDISSDIENRPEYVDYFGDSKTSFLESEEVQYENYNSGFRSEPRIIYNDDPENTNCIYKQKQFQHVTVCSAENMLAGKQSSKGNDNRVASEGLLPRTPQIHNRIRCISRELPIPLNKETQKVESSDLTKIDGGNSMAQNDRGKPEQMRSVSEDLGSKSILPKPVTRRSFSHPERETQQLKKDETSEIPSPRPLAEIIDNQRVNSTVQAHIDFRNSRNCEEENITGFRILDFY